MGLRLGITLLVFGILLRAENWPQWRGPSLNGVSAETNLPVKWTADEGVAWKIPLAERSGATPIVWGDRVFLSVAEKGSLYLWAVSARDGGVHWKKHLGDGDVFMRKQNMTSPSPATDGEWVWVLTGTGMLKAFDFAGAEKWSRDIQQDYGRFGVNWGYASSPLLYGDALYVQVIHGMRTKDPSYVLKFDKKTGKTVWRVERPTNANMESHDSYTTPTIAKVGTGAELIIAGGDVLTGHDLETGKELWRGGGFNPENNPFQRIIASPVVAGGIVYAPTRVKPVIAYRTGGRGDVTATHQVFQFNNGPDVPTPVVDGGLFYVVRDNGTLYCLDAATGKEIYGGVRLKTGTYSASPVVADGKIYLTSEEGVTSVFRTGPKFELLAENDVKEYTLSTVAVSGGHIFLRTSGHLYSIGKK